MLSEQRGVLRVVLTTGAVTAAMLGTGAVAEAETPCEVTGNHVPVACWEMNEPAGATVMHDTAPRVDEPIDAPIDQDGLDTGFVFEGATGYSWPRRPPNEPPASPERIIQIADDNRIDPDPTASSNVSTFTVEVRFRTREKFGNIAQKGQSLTRGGQWKIQNPQGRPSCLFKGSIGRVATRSTVFINDNLWHTLTCVRTPTRVTLLIDGVVNNWQNGQTGWINNAVPMTIGGKIRCDNIEVTCDYFSGQIDYVRLARGAP